MYIYNLFINVFNKKKVFSAKCSRLILNFIQHKNSVKIELSIMLHKKERIVNEYHTNCYKLLFFSVSLRTL